MISQNIDNVRRCLAAHNKSAQDITLVAVTKNHDVAAVREALAAGITDVGENRIQEAKEKFAALAADETIDFAAVKRHLIGHLQTNKAKDAVRLFDLIHSVDSLHLLSAVDKAAEKEGKIQDILLQVNLANEETKSGVSAQDLPGLLTAAKDAAHINLRGLMLIAPNFGDAEQCRPLFAKMRTLFDNAKNSGDFGGNFNQLSMGMSGDYTVAAEEGATIVRVGTAIFGARNYGG